MSDESSSEAGRQAASRGTRKPAGPTTRPAQVVNFPPRPRPPVRAPQPPAPSAPKAPATPEPPASLDDTPTPTPAARPTLAPHRPPAAAEPLVEGFFVARVMGEQEAHRHHLTREEGRQDFTGWRGFEEELGPLPREYTDDVAVALPRDPHSVFVMWDFSPATRLRALEGLEAPRAVLRVYEGQALVREVDFTLESRDFYLQGLPSGGPYRVEAHFVGRDGTSRRIGPASNSLFLPAEGPSEDTSVRFLHVPPPPPVEPPAPPLESSPLESRPPESSPPESSPLEPAAPRVGERTYLTWHRVPLPGSAGFQEGPGGPGPMARPHGRTGASARPWHPGALKRTEGSSEQTSWTPLPSGRGR